MPRHAGMCGIHDFMAKFLHRFLSPQRTTLYRRLAAELGRGDELVAALPRLAISDADPAVRRAALARCADLAVAQEASYVDADSDNRAYARALYFSLMAGTHEKAPPLIARLRLLESQGDLPLILHAAIFSPDQSLRDLAQRKLESDRFTATRGSHDDLGIADPIFNKARSRAILRRAIVTSACEVERALSANNHDAAMNWTDAMERFVGDWPVRWPLPHYVARTSRLLQETLFKATLPTRPLLLSQDTSFEAPAFNLPDGYTGIE